MHAALSRHLEGLRGRARALARQLHAVSPLATLGRGYAIVRTLEDGRVVTSSAQVSRGDLVEALLGKGSLSCRVEDVRTDRPPPTEEN